MQKANISSHIKVNYPFDSSPFVDAFYRAGMLFSLRHLMMIEQIEEYKALYALQKSLRVCELAGINSKHHFKQIYLSDVELGTLQIEWIMSKKGLNLVVMQIPSLSEKKARWLWELADK